jgi:multiple sugar transport system permease protein
MHAAPAGPPLRRRVHGLARKQAWLHVALMVPATLLIVLLIAYPIVVMTNLSFHELKLFQIMKGATSPFTWRNFERVLADGRTYTALRVTAVYVFASSGISFLWGLATALLLNQPFRGQRLARIAIVSPWAVAAVVASLIWMFLLNGQSGVVNYLLVLAGAIEQPINFPGRYQTALATVVFVSAWKGYPFFTIMLLAGLQAVPRDSVDAARVDGAGPIRRFFGVTLPSLRPVIAVALPLNLLSNFREVETIMVLTGGGPSRATETLALAIYNQTFQYFDVGRAAALGVLVFLLSVVLVIASLRLLLPKEPAR